MRRFQISALVWILAICPARAAVIEVSPLPDIPDVSIVTLSGPIVLGDGAIFESRTAALSRAIVVLASPGGNLRAGLVIGAAVHKKGFVTLAPEYASCASACGLIWIGGVRRVMARSAKVGFHSASDKTGAISGRGDAAIGSYFTAIGVPDRAIPYLTKAPPSEMQWLDVADAEKLGIAFETVGTTQDGVVALASGPAPASPPAPAAAPDDPLRALRAECSRRADALDLHDEPRLTFRAQCIAAERKPK